ncbi:MAG: hypothetical protein KDG54_06780 [Geminicoccaceae bacterium]|nr:hypothetical protein [Geminicoccaceae bacterium]
MTTIPQFFTLAAIIGAFLAILSVWSPRRTSVKVSAVLASILFLPLTYAAFAELLSKPKPVALEWWKSAADEATVLGSTAQENKGIFLWLQLDNIDEPRSYVLPWSRELAQQLQDAMEEAEKQKTGVRMRLPFESSLDNREPRFYALPQPALPPKDQLDGPQIYRQPSRET